MKIVLDNGNVLDDLDVSGNTFLSKKEINPDLFEGATSAQIIDGNVEHSIIIDAVYFPVTDRDYGITISEKSELETLESAISDLAELIGGLM